MENDKCPIGQINILDVQDFFDVIRLRLTRALDQTELRVLRQSRKSARFNAGHYIPGFINDVLTIERPDQNTLQFLADLSGATINYVEIARDFILPEGEAERLHDCFDEHFVQPWHRKHETAFRFKGTT